MADEKRSLDPEEIRRFYEDHKFWLRRIIRQNIGHSSEIEDVLQGFLLRLMEKPVSIDLIKKRGYQYRVLKNFMIDIKRNKRTYDKYVSNSAQFQNPAASYDPYKRAANRDDYQYLSKKADEYLPGHVALALQLRLVKDWTNEEVAEKMRVKRKTAIRYISIGKSILRKVMDKGFDALVILCFWPFHRLGVLLCN